MRNVFRDKTLGYNPNQPFNMGRAKKPAAAGAPPANNGDAGAGSTPETNVFQ